MEVINNLADLEEQVPVAVKKSFVHIVGYVVRSQEHDTAVNVNIKF